MLGDLSSPSCWNSYLSTRMLSECQNSYLDIDSTICVWMNATERMIFTCIFIFIFYLKVQFQILNWIAHDTRVPLAVRYFFLVALIWGILGSRSLEVTRAKSNKFSQNSLNILSGSFSYSLKNNAVFWIATFGCVFSSFVNLLASFFLILIAVFGCVSFVIFLIHREYIICNCLYFILMHTLFQQIS